MIHIKNNTNCCGCSACVQACPKNCISFSEDKHGFRYPLVDSTNCINCGLCLKVCPCLNQDEVRRPLGVYAAINPNNNIRMQSSSGGIFSLFAEAIIEQGGVVFAARFDENWEVKHDYTEKKEELKLFRGSKYVQSRIGTSYLQVIDFLKQDRKVLFLGTPCQIAGLKRFVRKEYDNLLTIDFVCHGTPSPAVWRNYLKETVEICKLKNVSFRDKKGYSWKRYGLTFECENSKLSTFAKDNLFFKGYMQSLFLRPSCFSCPAKSSKSNSDLTIADFWGIERLDSSMDDGFGTSMVIVNSRRGYDFLDDNKIIKKEMPIAKSLALNSSYFKSTEKPLRYESFFKDFENPNISTCDSISRNIKKYSVVKRIIAVLSNSLKKHL